MIYNPTLRLNVNDLARGVLELSYAIPHEPYPTSGSTPEYLVQQKRLFAESDKLNALKPSDFRSLAGTL